jgi:23S rRNA pseudouridine955/2504/2580 synthase
VEAQLDTGRTHQIRVHAQHLGAPIAGDPKYGDPAMNSHLRKLGLTRLFLHASTLSFRPREGSPEITVDAPLPSGLSALLATLEEQSWTPPATKHLR